MMDALEKVAFLPYGYLVDKWRFKVFRGEVAEKDFNQEWYRMRWVGGLVGGWVVRWMGGSVGGWFDGWVV